MFKRLLFICTAVFLLVFFTLPAFAYADEGDTNDFVGVDEGQYLLGDTSDTVGDNSHNENNHMGDGDTEAYCIDITEPVNDITLFGFELGGWTNDGYENTGAEIGDPSVLDPLNPINDGITEEEAANIQILAENATGATAAEDQVAVWINSDSDELKTVQAYHSLSLDSQDNVGLIFASVGSITDGNPGTDIHNSDGDLDNGESINEITVTLDALPMLAEHEATAIMEDPLVPTITDENKTVYWYLLVGSYNTSFSPTELVTETTSMMSDNPGAIADDTDFTNGITIDTYADNYGEATANYYYYYWGDPLYAANTMGVNLFAWVDIDEDEKLDIVDTAPTAEATEFVLKQTTELGVTDFQDEYELALPAGVNNGLDVINPLDELEDIDLHEIDGGIIIDHSKNVDKKWTLQKQGRCWVWVEVFKTSNDVQRFVTKSYDEPYSDASGTYVPTEGGGGPTPTPTPTPTPKPKPKGTVTVAGLTEGTIQVLAFTGMDPIIPIAGGSAVVAGLAMLLVTLKRRVIRK